MFPLLLLIAIHFASYGQSEKMFIIKEEVINEGNKKSQKDFKVKNSSFFEDENYLVSKTCSGEWGGTINFKNKRTGVEYSCSATCPVAVNKIKGKYIVTNTLAHLSGSSEVLEISNPDSLTIYKIPPPRAKKNKKVIVYVEDNESKSTKGSKSLVDSVGVLTLASWPYKGQLYHIVTDFRKTFLTKIENNRFVSIDLISDESIWTYEPEVLRTDDNHFVVFFKNDKENGYLEIMDNRINLMRYK